MLIYINEEKYDVRLQLVSVPDFIGTPTYNLEVKLFYEGAYGWEPFVNLTVNFGEFIAQKNTAYIDMNNCPFANVFLEKHFAIDTGVKKRSGFCEYPLWLFKEGFLRAVDARLYEKYSKEYEAYMSKMNGAADEEV